MEILEADYSAQPRPPKHLANTFTKNQNNNPLVYLKFLLKLVIKNNVLFGGFQQEVDIWLFFSYSILISIITF